MQRGKKSKGHEENITGLYARHMLTHILKICRKRDKDAYTLTKKENKREKRKESCYVRFYYASTKLTLANFSLFIRIFLYLFDKYKMSISANKSVFIKIFKILYIGVRYILE